MFPGQNSQFPGMGEQAYQTYDEAKRIFEIGSEVIGEDLAEICFGSETDKLSTSLVQPAIVAAELATYHALRQKGLKPELLMGHSLGEITALGAAESLSTEDVFRVTKVRAEVTQRSGETNPGAMAAIVGFSEEHAARIIAVANRRFQKIGETSAAYMANRNWRLEQVLSGHQDAIDRTKRVVERLKSLKYIDRAGVIKLKVPGAFHSPHNRDGVEELKDVFDSVDKKFPRVMLLNNRGQYMIDPALYANYYSGQLINGVEWDLMMHRAAVDGVRDFTEVKFGDDPKKATLSNFVMKEFENHEVVEAPFGQVVRIRWVPEDSEFMQNRIEAVTSLQTG